MFSSLRGLASGIFWVYNLAIGAGNGLFDFCWTKIFGASAARGELSTLFEGVWLSDAFDYYCLSAANILALQTLQCLPPIRPFVSGCIRCRCEACESRLNPLSSLCSTGTVKVALSLLVGSFMGCSLILSKLCRSLLCRYKLFLKGELIFFAISLFGADLFVFGDSCLLPV